MSNLIIIFAKQPIPGQTKTRLTPVLSPDEAAHLYHAFLMDKLASLAEVNADAAIAYYPAEGYDYFNAIASDFYLLEQAGATLTERLSNAVLYGFDQGYQRVMVADGDSPTLPPSYLNIVFDLLDEADVALGPAEDGGYYALAMNQPYTALFDIAFSTPTVAEDTAAIADELGLTMLWSEYVWYDVDEPQDIGRLYHDMRNLISPTSHSVATLIEKYPQLLEFD